MGPRLSGSPRTTARRRAVSLVTWGMIRSIGICLIVGEAGRQLPLVVTNITIIGWTTAPCVWGFASAQECFAILIVYFLFVPGVVRSL